MDSRPKLIGTALEHRYRVDALIARGGMSAVYCGLDTRLERPVAVKVMDAQYAGDRSFLERFELEARAAARLQHPGVVAVYDQGIHHGSEGDLVYLAMELVEGGTLRDLIRERGALPPQLALSVLEPMLSALAAAHRSGMVHRDIKPENVLIGSGGTVKVADFGLVRAAAASSNTSGSVILGTVAYLSPEQVTTGSADARSDVYGAGVVLYEMLTGTPPYTGDTALSVAYRHVNDDVPPPSDSRPTLPAALDDLVLRATRRDPDARPPDAAALRNELQAVASGLNLEQTTVPVPAAGAATAPGPALTESVTDPPTDRLGPDTRPVSAEQPTGAVQGAAGGPRGTRALSRSDVLAQRAQQQGGLTGAPRPLPPDPRRRRNRRLVAVWTLVVLVLAGLVGTFAWWMGSGRFTEVPRTTGVVEDAASSALRGADLVPEVRREHNDAVPSGTVISSDPAQGARAMRGDEITLVVSLGKPTVPPISAGGSVAEAQRAIERANLRPRLDGSADQYSSEIPKGEVIGVEPGPGTRLRTGTPVTVIVSKGPRPVAVPEVQGLDHDDAFAKLRALGFQPYDAGQQFSPDVDGGQVVTTTPSAGTQVVPAEQPRVGVVVSNAVSVPNVLGATVGQARQQLAQLGIDVRVQQFVETPQSRVVGVSPRPGQRLPRGSSVTLTAFP